MLAELGTVFFKLDQLCKGYSEYKYLLNSARPLRQVGPPDMWKQI